MRIAAVDPGLKTGVCVVDFESDNCTKVMSDELGYDKILGWCRDYVPYVDRIAVERFTITPSTGKNSQAPWSLMCIGVVTALAIDAGKDAVLDLQKPADAMSLVPNDMLRTIGIWHRGGEGHANDALRHAVLCAIRQGWRHPSFITD